MTKIHVKRLYTATLGASVDVEARTLPASQIVYISSSQYFLKTFKVNLSNKYDREIELL